MNFILFQQESAPGGSAPWPVLFTEGRIIHGRPDATGLIGFSPERDPMGQASTMTTASAVTDAASLVGQYPIFIDGGNMFSDTRPIAEAHPWVGTPEGIEALSGAEALQRKNLEDLGVVSQTWTVIAGNAGTFGYQPIAALAGRHQIFLAGTAVVLYVQSLNAAGAMQQADVELNADVEVSEEE